LDPKLFEKLSINNGKESSYRHFTEDM